MVGIVVLVVVIADVMLPVVDVIILNPTNGQVGIFAPDEGFPKVL